MYKEKCFSSHSQVERWGSYKKGSLTFNKLRGWGCISYAVETTEKEKYIFGVNNPIPLYSAGIILKHSSINQQLDCINRQMGSWSFRKAVGQSSSVNPIWQPEGGKAQLSVSDSTSEEEAGLPAWLNGPLHTPRLTFAI